jgi:MoaA/NifB/PqqE/SkfB family radical SAM enzyme
VAADGATAVSYLATRGLDAFDVVCRGITGVAGLGVPVTLRVTVQRANYRELPALVDLAHRLGVARISFLAADLGNTTAFGREGLADRSLAMALDDADLRRFAAVLDALAISHAGDFATGFIAENPVKLRRLLQYYRALRGRAPLPPTLCNAPEFSAVIEADGRLRPCFFIAGPEAQQRSGDWSLTLNGPAMQALRATIRAGERPECRACVCCMWRDPASFMAAGSA